MTDEEVSRLWSEETDGKLEEWMKRAGQAIASGMRTDWTPRDANFAARVIALCKPDA